MPDASEIQDVCKMHEDAIAVPCQTVCQKAIPQCTLDMIHYGMACSYTVRYKTRIGRGPGLIIKLGTRCKMQTQRMHVSNDYRATKSHEILMLVCLIKYVKPML